LPSHLLEGNAVVPAARGAGDDDADGDDGGADQRDEDPAGPGHLPDAIALVP